MESNTYQKNHLYTLVIRLYYTKFWKLILWQLKIIKYVVIWPEAILKDTRIKPLKYLFDNKV